MVICRAVGDSGEGDSDLGVVGEEVDEAGGGDEVGSVGAVGAALRHGDGGAGDIPEGVGEEGGGNK